MVTSCTAGPRSVTRAHITTGRSGRRLAPPRGACPPRAASFSASAASPSADALKSELYTLVGDGSAGVSRVAAAQRAESVVAELAAIAPPPDASAASMLEGR